MAVGSRVEIIESVLRAAITDSAITLSKERAKYIANRILDLLDRFDAEDIIPKGQEGYIGNGWVNGMVEARCSVRELDNRDMDETWIHMKVGGLYPNVLRVSREEAKRLLESFFVNRVQDEFGRVKKEKLDEYEGEMEEGLQDILDWVYQLIAECGFEVDESSPRGIVVRRSHDDLEKDFKKAFPELAKEMRRG